MRSVAWNELKLQVRETFSSTIVRESADELFFSSRGHATELVTDFQSMQSLGLLGLVFNAGLSV